MPSSEALENGDVHHFLKGQGNDRTNGFRVVNWICFALSEGRVKLPALRQSAFHECEYGRKG